jgi:hypothetical protein
MKIPILIGYKRMRIFLMVLKLILSLKRLISFKKIKKKDTRHGISQVHGKKRNIDDLK